jgi:hypothetical protein
LNEVASKPALFARAETDIPCASAIASMADQICLRVNVLLSAPKRNKMPHSGGSRVSVEIGLFSIRRFEVKRFQAFHLPDV